MNYVQHTEADRTAMLAAMGKHSIDELFETIPPECRFQGELPVEPALTEDALLREMKGLADRNVSAHDHPSFLGAGLYRHFCPALVDNLVARTEFWTAYTPYQPEASQGTLISILEWQTMMCRLTGMTVSNASLYDGATAVVEAVLMALRLKQDAKAPAGRVLKGKDDLRAYFADKSRAHREARYSEARIHRAGDKLFGTFRVTGIDHAGRAFDRYGIDLYEVKDGKIALKDSYLKAD